MKASYKLVVTTYSNVLGDRKDIFEFDNIEDAREEFANQLMYFETDYYYFADKADVEDEIAYAEESREDWSNEQVDTYIAALREGINSGFPFIANPHTGQCFTSLNDYFSNDSYSIEIEIEEATCEPFEPGTSYPVVTKDEQGNYKWSGYVDGKDLVGLSYLEEFAWMPDKFQKLVLDNTNVEDHEAIEDGQVWINNDLTMRAVFFGD